MYDGMLLYTINGERFTGLNFYIFQEYHDSFPADFFKIIQALYNGIMLSFKRKAPPVLNVRYRQSCREEKLHWVESAKV